MQISSWRSPILFLCLLLPIFSCKKPPKNIQPAFYHWKTQLILQCPETAYLDSLGCRQLYIKFLDIAKNDEGLLQPYSLLEVLDTAGLAGKTIIPCVFLTNNVFQDISEAKLDWLAQQTAAALNSVGAQFPNPIFKEIQFDCDWTATTRAAFFSFLKKIRARLPAECQLSATIRLHQYKFPDRTGVPPVDRGMLMLYNTGDIDEPTETNSIFKTADAEKYLQGAPANYPLPLDLALPLFSWALVYRDAELWKIIPEPNPTELQDTSRYTQVQTPNFKLQTLQFMVQNSTFLGGHYLRPGDLIRLEVVDMAVLRQAAQLATKVELAPDARLAFYHLDTAAIRRFPADFLKKMCETIRKE